MSVKNLNKEKNAKRREKNKIKNKSMIKKNFNNRKIKFHRLRINSKFEDYKGNKLCLKVF